MGVETPRKRPQQARSRTTVAIIVEAAIQVLQRESDDGVTTTRIAERAGVSVGTLYGYFRNRDEVLAAVAAEQSARLAQFMREMIGVVDTLPLDVACAEHIDGVLDIYAEFAALNRRPEIRRLMQTPAVGEAFVEGQTALATSIGRYAPRINPRWLPGVAGGIMTSTRELLLSVGHEATADDWTDVRRFLVGQSRQAIEQAATLR